MNSGAKVGLLLNHLRPSSPPLPEWLIRVGTIEEVSDEPPRSEEELARAVLHRIERAMSGEPMSLILEKGEDANAVFAYTNALLETWPVVSEAVSVMRPGDGRVLYFEHRQR